MNVDILASTSRGNCIIVEDSGSKVMLDAGLSIRKISKRINLNEIECVLISHSHMDHYKATPELIRRGMDVYVSKETAIEKETPPCLLAKELKQIETHNWLILPFDLEHDVHCLGFLGENKTSGNKFLYVVDAPRINYDFNGINTWIVEANFAKEILENGNYEEFVKDRIKRSHMSIENLVAFMKSSDLSKTEAIYLVHLSDSNSHERKFIEQVQQATGVPVYTDSDFVVPQQKPT